MIQTATSALLALVAAAAAGVLVRPALLESDYTTIPPSPAEVARQIAASPVDLSQAIGTASKAAGGAAGSARFGKDGVQGGVPLRHIHVQLAQSQRAADVFCIREHQNHAALRRRRKFLLDGR